MENVKNSDMGKSKDVFFSSEYNKKCIKKTFSCYSKTAFEKIRDAKILGIPKIFDISEDEENLYVTEEFIEGKSLLELLESGKDFSEKEAEEIIVKVAEILSKIHKIDPPIIHRDIKPGNIMMDKKGSVYLIDFDAAKQVSPNECRDTVLIGTEGFAAPEQYGFMSSDPRTDIYSLGATFNYLLTGKLPTEELTDGKFAKVISKATEMDPKNRYLSAEEMIKAIKDAGKKENKVRNMVLPAVIIALIIALIFIFKEADLLNLNSEEYKAEETETSIIKDADTESVEEEKEEEVAETVYHGEMVDPYTDTADKKIPGFCDDQIRKERVFPYKDGDTEYYLGMMDYDENAWYYGGGMGRNSPCDDALKIIPWIFTKEYGVYKPVSEEFMDTIYEKYSFSIEIFPDREKGGAYFPIISKVGKAEKGMIMMGFDKQSAGLWIVSCKAVSKEDNSESYYFTRQEFNYTTIHTFDLSDEKTVEGINGKIAEILSSGTYDRDNDIIDILISPGTYEGIITIPQSDTHLRIMAKDFEEAGRTVILNGGIKSNCVFLDLTGFDLRGAGKENEYWSDESSLKGCKNTGVYGKCEATLIKCILTDYYLARDGEKAWCWSNISTTIKDCHIGLDFYTGVADGGCMEMVDTVFTKCDIAIRVTNNSRKFNFSEFTMDNVQFIDNGEDIKEE